jgi:hypothetical protein
VRCGSERFDPRRLSKEQHFDRQHLLAPPSYGVESSAMTTSFWAATARRVTVPARGASTVDWVGPRWGLDQDFGGKPKCPT